MARAATKQLDFNYAVLLLYSVLLGLFAGAVTVLFIFLFESVQRLLWTDLPATLSLDTSHSLFPIVVCTIGGGLVGLAIKQLGDYPGTIEEAIATFKKTKQFDYQHIWQAFVISIISLGSGAALGPEAALTSIVGGFVTLIGIKLHRASLLRYGAEIDKKLPKLKRTILGIAAAIVGVGFFNLFGNNEYFNLNLLSYQFAWSDVLWMLLLTAAGIVVGLLYTLLDTSLENKLRKIRQRYVILTAMLGGLGLGILASLQPLALFSGHEGLTTISSHFLYESGTFLLLAGLVKILAASICLATGWKGGRFFPVMFAGGAIGMALAQFIPSIPPTLGLAVGMSATLAYVLKQPIVTIVLLVFFLPANLYLLIAAAAFLAAAASKKLSPTAA